MQKILSYGLIAGVFFLSTVTVAPCGDGGWVMWRKVYDMYRDGSSNETWSIIDGFDTAKECSKKKSMLLEQVVSSAIEEGKTSSQEAFITVEGWAHVTYQKGDWANRFVENTQYYCLPNGTDPRVKDK